MKARGGVAAVPSVFVLPVNQCLFGYLGIAPDGAMGVLR